MNIPPHPSPRGGSRNSVAGYLLLVAGLLSPAMLSATGDDTARTIFRAGVFYGAGVMSASGAYQDFFTGTMYFDVRPSRGDTFSGYRNVTPGGGILLTAEWTGVSHWGFGAALATHGRFIGSEPYVDASGYNHQRRQVSLRVRHSSMGYYALVTAEPWPRPQGSKIVRFTFGVGAGVTDVSVDFGDTPGSGDRWWYSSTTSGYSYTAPQTGLLLLGVAEWRITRTLLIGLGVVFRWMPDLEVAGGRVTTSSAVETDTEILLPPHTMNFSTLHIGMRIAGMW
ncbi:MAG: hypothetical protein HY962_08490 [Ignavibacteriae bacterium]|nr:hypothetical protein [Ignavibacteriota bacterium]